MVADVSVTYFSLATFAVFIYLSVKQTVFCTNRVVNIDFSKALCFFSYMCVILICLRELSLVLVNKIPTRYISTLKGCVYVPLNSTSSAIFVIICSVVLFSGQVMFVDLLIYLLRKHNN